ncbi:nuclear transport factor 2 family protein [Candidatus Poriferisocius sp.]|uniref:nuclear transport factor 2 family protein n=1 Tax=Candidatus Poriferisocius sp. TaxID=3101276 RepID=UPI003B5CE37D
MKDYFVALNGEDWDLMASVLHPELDLIPSGSRPRIGSDKAIAMFQKIFERFPIHQDNPTRFICDDNTVVVEIAFNGATQEGQEVSFVAVDIFDVDNGKIFRLSQWFDTAALAAALQGQ